MENVSEMFWAILRSLSRDIEHFPMSITDVECQVIPFWTGYNSHDVCEEASLVIWKVLSLLYLIDTCRIHESIGDGHAWKTALAIYCLCIDIYIVSTFLYETSTLTDRNNAIWDINTLFDLSRDIEHFPMSITDVECQVIPFWTGYNSSLLEYTKVY
jgi:hypothetical protein